VCAISYIFFFQFSGISHWSLARPVIFVVPLRARVHHFMNSSSGSGATKSPVIQTLLAICYALDMYRTTGVRPHETSSSHKAKTENCSMWPLATEPQPYSSHLMPWRGAHLDSYKLFCVRPMPDENGLDDQPIVISPHVQLIIQDAVSRMRR
jgi:hypothetical protein